MANNLTKSVAPKLNSRCIKYFNVKNKATKV